MAPTSDERCEVAARLRSAAKTDSGSPDYLWNRLEIAVNGWRFGDVIDDSYVFYNGVLERLADLIDPTCEVVLLDDESMRLPHCSRCRQPILKPLPNFCPCCGARVTSGGDS